MTMLMTTPLWQQVFGTPAMDVALSVLMLATVVLGMISLFGHGTAAKLSPQREVAIAAGHDDRRTAFEKPLIGGVLWVLLMAAHSMKVPRLKKWIARTLTAAGSPNFYTAEEYLALSLLAGVALASVVGGFLLMVSGETQVIVSLVLLALGMGGVLLSLRSKARKRLRSIQKDLPYALDLVALAMGAGATFTEALRTVVRDSREGDAFLVELRTVLAEMELGTTRRKALQNLVERVPLEMLQTIVASVIQAEELGTPLGDVLRDQATLLRLQRSVRAEEAAARAGILILLPCILLVFAVGIVMLGPFVLKVLGGGLI